MAAKEAKVSYDQEEDVLYVRLDRPISDSLQVGDFIVDFSKDNKIVGLEMLNASKLVSMPEGVDVKKSLASVEKASFGVREVRDVVIIGVAMKVMWQKKEYRPSMQVPIPLKVISR
jgi:uncharacterized protein YuzE